MNRPPMDALTEIQSDLQNMEENAAVYEMINFDARADAIDFIDFHIIDRVEGLLQHTAIQKELKLLKRRAEQLKGLLEQEDTHLFSHLRENIRTGISRGPSFMKMINRYARYYPGNAMQDKPGYDNLDAFINGLLSNEAIPEPTLLRKPEMVFYQKTPARIIFQMAQQAQLKRDDVFFDIGSGLGQVAILMNLVSEVPAVGIEYEPAYCNYAKARASHLGLPNVQFINTDACDADYSRGTVFFMYTPFEGEMLQEMLSILQNESQKRPVKIFTYGPCSAEIAKQSWLTCVNGPADNLYKLYEFKSRYQPISGAFNSQ